MAIVDDISWWQRLYLPWRKWRIVLKVASGSDIPENLPYKGVILVKSSQYLTWLAFDCPCRIGHRVMLNLDTQRKPSWTLTNIKPLTVSPSIDELGPNRHCHYFIKNGRIKWAKYNVRGTE